MGLDFHARSDLSFAGDLAPVTTPFGKNGELDRAAFEHNIRAHMQAGLQGVVVTGSTGEAALLDDRERETLLEWARREFRNDRLADRGRGRGIHAHHARVRGARRGARRRCGSRRCAALLRRRDDAGRVAGALSPRRRQSPVPVILYNIPKYMHFRLAPSLVQSWRRTRTSSGSRTAPASGTRSRSTFLRRATRSRSSRVAVSSGAPRSDGREGGHSRRLAVRARRCAIAVAEAVARGMAGGGRVCRTGSRRSRK